jgi:hypothetical protein
MDITEMISEMLDEMFDSQSDDMSEDIALGLAIDPRLALSPKGNFYRFARAHKQGE